VISNPWLALDTTTVPVVRARELRQAWEEFLDDGQLTEVRAPIAHSWERCTEAGVDPSALRLAPSVTGAEETSERWAGHPLGAAADLIRSCLGPIADADGNLIVVSDADGVLLWVRGPDSVKLDAADAMNFTEGAGWGEVDAGTNAIGTALAADHAVQVFAAEHFNEIVQQWTCAAAPVHDPDTGRPLGVIDLTGRMITAHPHSLACAVATAQAVQSHLRYLMQERDAHLRACYEERVAGRRRQALVTPSGRVIAGDHAWTGAERLLVPAGGGALVLPSGLPAFAEPVGHEEAFVVAGTQRLSRCSPRARTG
jgi:transcriptional regulator of acetoin/glycerol metabolism